MIHLFRQHRNTATGRNLLSALLGAWLLLFLSPCAMAAAAELSAVHADDNAMACPACHVPCHEYQACADPRPAPLVEAVPVGQQDTGFPFLPVMEGPLPEPPHRAAVLLPHPPPDATGVKQHPALSFRVLRI